ncbi:hypothetical protein P9027_32315 [Bacillus thuringiensis]|uniref:hypothetical protein n=1 Tax=Bacillus cereus group TaxID=86661 RepID=UPI002DBD0FB0|nr:hypothetical protein [Bacillus thuringiensis]MEC3226588.1 hypothetical protein [Bacillus thuringiensis]MEC3461689.1 hypothetical protein [Bacillus thuringiensis]MEC3553389.1 hypothetical protein [Bacillus thuringiensis]MED2059566.1 hypothetical protein [Bacillus thuringiensis]
MSKIDSLLRRARKLQADRIPTSKVHTVSDIEDIERISLEEKAKENMYIINNVPQNCIDCDKHFSECKCDESSYRPPTEKEYAHWKETSPRHYERLVRLRDQDEQHEKTYGLDKWIEDNVLYVRKKKVNGATDKIDQIPLSQMSDEMREVLCKDVKRI